MIRLTKRELSPALQGVLQNHIKKYQELKAADQDIPKGLLNAYNTPEVKELLKEETSCKCAYCESKMLHVDYGDIEHIVPKGDDPMLRYSYENLTLACGVCNTKKSAHVDILNPYVVDPEDHLFACGPLIFRMPHSDVGAITEKRLDLNRAPLVEKRKERIEALQTIADQIVRTNNDSLRQLLIEEFEEQCSETMEYSLAAKAYARQVRHYFAA